MKKITVEILAVAVLFALTGALHLGANVFAGKIVAPMDLLYVFSGWQETGITPGSVPCCSLGRSDVLDQDLPVWIFLRESLTRSRFPLWNPLPDGGQPGALWLPTGVPTIGFLVFLIFGNGLGFTLVLLARLVIAGMGAYLLCRTKLKFLPSVFGGFTYMLCGFNSSWLMVDAVETSMWVPWVLWAIVRLEAKPSANRLAVLACLVSVMIFGGFPAVAGYALYASALLSIWLLTLRVLKERKISDVIRRGILISSGWLLGVGLASAEVVPFIEYFQQFDLSYRHGYGISVVNAILLLNPFRLGPPAVEDTGYVGIIGMGLALLAIFYGLLKRQNYGTLSPKFWAFLVTLTFVIIYRSPAGMAALIYHLPVFNSSLNGRMFALLGLEFAVLGAVGLQTLSTILETLLRKLKDNYYRVMPRWRLLMVILLVAIVALQATDLSRVGMAQNVVLAGNTFFPDTPTIEYVRQHLQPGQSVIETVDAFGTAGMLPAYGIPDWFAHGFQTTQEKKILSQIVENAWVTPTAAAFFFDANNTRIGLHQQINLQSPYIDALGIRYILTSSMPPISKSLMSGWKLLTPGKYVKVLERQSTPPGAYFLSENSSMEEPNPRAWSWSHVTSLSYDSDRQVFRVVSNSSGWLVRIARDYPGWVAYVNGKPGQTSRYLDLLPIVHVGPGVSIVEWHYEPWSVKLGAAITGITLTFLISICLFYYLKRPARVLATRKEREPSVRST
jgi:hypothetical protein